MKLCGWIETVLQYVKCTFDDVYLVSLFVEMLHHCSDIILVCLCVQYFNQSLDLLFNIHIVWLGLWLSCYKKKRKWLKIKQAVVFPVSKCASERCHMAFKSCREKKSTNSLIYVAVWEDVTVGIVRASI